MKVSRERRTDKLVAELTEQERGRTLVFVRTKRGADRLAKQLSRVATVKVAAMHGDKSQSQRERALAQFESGRIDTLVATDVAARGIDVRDVTHVINFDAPGATDDYVHRVGRTARAGADRRRHHVRARGPGPRGRLDGRRPRPAPRAGGRRAAGQRARDEHAVDQRRQRPPPPRPQRPPPSGPAAR